MAIANLLGSNLFNMLVLAVDDLAFAAPLLSEASGAHLLTVLTALLMTGIVTVGLGYRLTARAGPTVSWVSIALLLAYAANILMLTQGHSRLPS